MVESKEQGERAVTQDELIDATARTICRENCAFRGEPPCFEIGNGLLPDCDEPGCYAFAMAAINARKTGVIHASVCAVHREAVEILTEFHDARVTKYYEALEAERAKLREAVWIMRTIWPFVWDLGLAGIDGTTRDQAANHVKAFLSTVEEPND